MSVGEPELSFMVMEVLCELSRLAPRSNEEGESLSFMVMEVMCEFSSLAPRTNEGVSEVQLLTFLVMEFLCWFFRPHATNGILGNSKADNAARSRSDHMRQSVLYQDLKTSIQHYIHLIWQETWDQQNINKLHSSYPPTAHWAAVPVRRHYVRLTRLRIGHTRLTHRHLLLGEGLPPDGRGYELVSSVRALVPQKFSVEEELMHVKHVDVKSPHVGVMWKFGKGVISSGIVLVT
ncbi:RNase H domain-containing protein [Trichonephila clavipes]|nr:RNase H domain-containing protein [Trichonephila clavipes]